MTTISPETLRDHRANWFVYAGDERIPFARTMRGTWGFDVVCSCGWDSHIGGGTRTAVRRALEDHRSDVQFQQGLRTDALAAGIDPDNRTDMNLWMARRLLEG